MAVHMKSSNDPVPTSASWIGALARVRGAYRRWYGAFKWSLRGALFAGLPPVAFFLVSVAFGSVPVLPGPAGSVTILPAELLCSIAFGTSVPGPNTADSLQHTVTRQVFFLTLNFALWLFVFMLATVVIRRVWHLRSRAKGLSHTADSA